MNKKIRKSKVRLSSHLRIETIAERWIPVLRGWFNYYGKFYLSRIPNRSDKVQQRTNTLGKADPQKSKRELPPGPQMAQEVCESKSRVVLALAG